MKCWQNSRVNVTSIDALNEERKAFSSRSYKSWKYVLPPFPEPSASCDLLLLSCHLFASSNNIRLFGIAPFSESRATLSHFLACEERKSRQFFLRLSDKIHQNSSRQFSGLKPKLKISSRVKNEEEKGLIYVWKL